MYRLLGSPYGTDKKSALHSAIAICDQKQDFNIKKPFLFITFKHFNILSFLNRPLRKKLFVRLLFFKKKGETATICFG
jgi:hypothetical protein